jgi:methionyl aminopeptidase
MITLKTPAEIAAMKKAGEAVDCGIRNGFKFIEESLLKKQSITKADVNKVLEQSLADCGVESAFHGFGGYEHISCISVNDEIVHGVPNDSPIVDGDVVTIDFGAVYKGWNGDAAWTSIVGDYKKEDYTQIQDMIDQCHKALQAGIQACRKGNTLEDLTRAIYEVLQASGYGIVTKYTGHGIGREMHEDPPIWNTLPIPPEYANIKLRKGMVFCLEPMLTLTKDPKTIILEDKWTVASGDGAIATHSEQMVAIVDNGPFVLTNPGA